MKETLLSLSLFLCLVLPVVKEMLRFLYTDRVEKMDQLAKDLRLAADKYLITSLKSLCLHLLILRVSLTIITGTE